MLPHISKKGQVKIALLLSPCVPTAFLKNFILEDCKSALLSTSCVTLEICWPLGAQTVQAESQTSKPFSWEWLAV